MAFRFIRSLLSRSHRAPALFESLEQRLALYTDPFLGDFPALSAMKNINDTVIRFQTNQGVIDIEVFDRGGPPSPVTAANFIKYVTTGRYDNSFFHRMISNFVLQGGGFVDDPTTVPPASSQYSSIVTDPAIVNEYSDARKNTERTIAMAKLGGDPNSATSQFFFNLKDNTDLDTQNGGFTVFGKVIKGWEIIEDIEDFTTKDLNNFLGGNAFGQVPLSNENDNTSLIRIIDAEVIKPADQTLFFNESVYFPEGFRSGRIVSSIDLVNEDANASTLYQVIVRYETGTRDTQIFSGTLTPGASIHLQVSKAGDPSINNVKAQKPFAYVVRASGKVSATLIHNDYGSTASEAFFQPEPFDADQLKSWSFAGAQKSPGISAFVVWENLASTTNALTISLFAGDGTVVTLTKTLQPYRRGGLDLSQITGLPNGLLAIRVTSAQPIVAAMSLYRAAPARAAIELGVPNKGSVEGILPGASIAAGSQGQAIISVLRTSDTVLTAVTVDFEFILTDGSIFTNTGTVSFATGSRLKRYDLSTLNGALPRDQFFTIRYKVRNAAEPIAISYYSLANGGDAVATSFQTYSAEELIFAGGYTDPAGQGQEVISIFNPYTEGNVEAIYRLRFHFVDGTSDEIIIPPGGGGTLATNRRIDISTRNLTEVMARINSDAKYRNYSISLSATINNSGGTRISGAIFAQLTRTDPAGNSATFGPSIHSGSDIFFADNSQFGSP